jgi:hypothetical protein
MTARCTLIASDYRAFQRHVLFRYRKIHWVYGGVLTIILLVSWFGAPPEATRAEKISTLVGSVIIFSGLVAVLSVIVHFLGSRFRGTLGEHIFDISEAGITESNASGKIETHVVGIRGVDEAKNHFFVITKSGLGHVLPKRDLETSEPIRALQAAVRTRAT